VAASVENRPSPGIQQKSEARRPGAVSVSCFLDARSRDNSRAGAFPEGSRRSQSSRFGKPYLEGFRTENVGKAHRGCPRQLI
jgi:hypothetical protein